MGTYRLGSVFAPDSVAVIGASERVGSLGHGVMAQILAGGFRGRIVPVNPKRASVMGLPCVAGLADLAEPPELIVVATPAASVPGVIREAVEAGVRAAIVLTAGLGDGPDSYAAEMMAIARAAGLRIVGPNCLGVLAPPVGLNASFSPVLPKPGRLALIAQSGAIAASVAAWAARRDLGLSAAISIGNALDVDVGDCLDWFAEDASTRAILVYVESVRDAAKFMSAARKAARIKPVVVLKSGRHAAGARAAATHTGALAGSDAVYDAAIRRAGCLRVADLRELFTAAETLALHDVFSGDRIALLTNGGGFGVLAADRLEDLGGRLAELAPETLAALDVALPDTWSHGNPIDIIGDAPPERYAAAMDALLADPGTDAVLVLNCPTALAPPEAQAEAVAAAVRAGGTTPSRPVFAVWVGGGEERIRHFQEDRIAAYETESDAVEGLMQLVRIRRLREALAEAPPLAAPIAPDRARAGQALAAAAAEGRAWLSPVEVYDLLDSYGIPAVPVRLAADSAAAADAGAEWLARGQSCAVKIQSRDIVHKSEVDGVRLGVATTEAMMKAAEEIMARARLLRPEARIEGVTVQPMIQRPHARELIVGVAPDPVFGPVILFGHGGTAVEVINDKAIGLLPLDLGEARRLIADTRVARLLAGYRNVPAAPVEALADLLVRVSRLVEDFPAVRGLDLNPVLASHEGLIALDARVEITCDADARPRFAVRPYPRDLEGEVVTRSGVTLALRPIRPTDAPALLALVGACSADDLRMRFFTTRRSLDPELIARLTQIDYAREMAFVALAPEGHDLLAVARLHGDADGEHAEYAILVRTDFQGQHIAYSMMERLITFARERGYRTVWGHVLAANHRMLMMCGELGFTIGDAGSGDEMRKVVLRL
ncbi:MAG TPA: bifunctional acetate--CoA ligase family protein/GNAT family N-acetyltransferase [Rhabdaerophilum sp.]|nr:bifunctional acetate--CoA ligase family protein/GNAT family N-acetyltransferase [Rhabdaerophilum sp.]